MKIGEIPTNATIQIRAVKGERKFECLAVVVATRDDGLYLSPVKHEGKILDFSGSGIQLLTFYVNENGQAFGWSGCRIRTDIYQRKRCHLLTTKSESVRVNRRSEPRIRTEIKAVLRTISDDRKWDIVVRNYSAHGLGFVCAKSIPERDRKPVTIIYEDKLYPLEILMRADILRETETGNGMFKYGAYIPQPDKAWTEYVQNKLERIKEQHRPAEDEDAHAK